jgi:hypothetical protein
MFKRAEILTRTLLNTKQECYPLDHDFRKWDGEYAETYVDCDDETDPGSCPVGGCVAGSAEHSGYITT